MTNILDEDFWREALSKPTWYLLLNDDFERLEQLAKNESDYDKRKQIKDKAYSLDGRGCKHKTYANSRGGR